MPSGTPTQWFEREFGFPEPTGTAGGGFAACRACFHYDPAAHTLAVVSPAAAAGDQQQRVFHVGPFETPSVAELRAELDAHRAAAALAPESGLEPEPESGPETEPAAHEQLGGLTFACVVGCAKTLHLNPRHRGAVFQVASQFNCLEMVGPGSAPEGGVTCYAKDHTQGPACAMACPAATVYRNYFWGRDARGQCGGSARQLNCASDLGDVRARCPVRCVRAAGRGAAAAQPFLHGVGVAAGMAGAGQPAPRLLAHGQRLPAARQARGGPARCDG